jgi:Stress responsive A/B Barrel Domain
LCRTKQHDVELVIPSDGYAYPLNSNVRPQEHTMIRHTVTFKLKHPTGSVAEASFLKAAKALTTIPTVRNFEWLRQVSPKNEFKFGFSMEFFSQQDYEAYNVHPEHVRFVEERWKQEVEDFLEIDYLPFVPE